MKYYRFRRECRTILPAVVVMVVIYAFSSQESTESYGLSSRVADVFAAWGLDERIPLINDSWVYTVRKMAHITLYAVLGVVTSYGAVTFLKRRGVGHHYVWGFVLSVLLCFCYACLDEFHQTFIEGRTGKFSDVGYDAVGFVTMATVTLTVRYLVRKRRYRNRRRRARR